ncbi:unnamed protein product [Musa hybrid cultivar]
MTRRTSSLACEFAAALSSLACWFCSSSQRAYSMSNARAPAGFTYRSDSILVCGLLAIERNAQYCPIFSKDFMPKLGVPLDKLCIRWVSHGERGNEARHSDNGLLSILWATSTLPTTPHPLHRQHLHRHQKNNKRPNLPFKSLTKRTPRQGRDAREQIQPGEQRSNEYQSEFDKAPNPRADLLHRGLPVLPNHLIHLIIREDQVVQARSSDPLGQIPLSDQRIHPLPHWCRRFPGVPLKEILGERQFEHKLPQEPESGMAVPDVLGVGPLAASHRVLERQVQQCVEMLGGIGVVLEPIGRLKGVAQSLLGLQEVRSALLSRDGGRQELRRGRDLRDNWGLLRKRWVSLASSRGGLRMKRRGGTFFLGKATFLRSASSLRRRWGLLGGASCGVLVATARARRRAIGRREWGNLRWDWRGAAEREDEKERSKEGRRWREEESSICVRERGLSGHQWRSFGGLQRGVGRREIRGGEEEIDSIIKSHWNGENERMGPRSICIPTTPRGCQRHPTFLLLERCPKTLSAFNQLHSHFITTGLARHTYPLSRLLLLFSSLPSPLPSLPHAAALLCQPLLSSSSPSPFLPNTLVSSLADVGRPHLALSLYSQVLLLQPHSPKPNNHTFPSLLKACAAGGPSWVPVGRALHAHVVKFIGHDSVDHFVRAALLSFYSRCGDVSSGRRLFDRIPNPDLPAWNCMLLAYARCYSDVEDADSGMQTLFLFRKLQLSSTFRPNEITLVALIGACGDLGALGQGIWAHAYIEQNHLIMNQVVATSLIDMPPFILRVRDSTCSGVFSFPTTSISNLSTTQATMDFICTYAISFPRHILGPAWNTGNRNGLSGLKTPFSSHLSGLYSLQSRPHMSSNLPMA